MVRRCAKLGDLIPTGTPNSCAESEVLPIRATKSQQASLDEYIEVGPTRHLSGVSEPMFIEMDITRWHPPYLHIFLGLVNDEVSAIRDEMPKLDPAGPLLISADAAGVQKGGDEKHVSNASVGGDDEPLVND